MSAKKPARRRSKKRLEFANSPDWVIEQQRKVSPEGLNEVQLTAQIEQLGLIRYTPAGLMALDCSLKAESVVVEAGKPRKISLEIKAVGIGEVVKSLQALGVGKAAVFRGFLTHQRNGRGFIAHVTCIEPLSAPVCSNPD